MSGVGLVGLAMVLAFGAAVAAVGMARLARELRNAIRDREWPYAALLVGLAWLAVGVALIFAGLPGVPK